MVKVKTARSAPVGPRVWLRLLVPPYTLPPAAAAFAAGSGSTEKLLKSGEVNGLEGSEDLEGVAAHGVAGAGGAAAGGTGGICFSFFCL